MFILLHIFPLLGLCCLGRSHNSPPPPFRYATAHNYATNEPLYTDRVTLFTKQITVIIIIILISFCQKLLRKYHKASRVASRQSVTWHVLKIIYIFYLFFIWFKYLWQLIFVILFLRLGYSYWLVLTLLNYHILISIAELSYVYSLTSQASLFIL
jgi:hypothetical protein